MSEPNLFDVKPKQRKQRKPAVGATVLQDVMSQYRTAYRKRFNEDPHVTARDFGQVSQLIRQFGVDTVRRRLAIYMEWDDKFVAEDGWGIGLFVSNWRRLVAIEHQQRRTASALPDVDSTREYLRRIKEQAE